MTEPSTKQQLLRDVHLSERYGRSPRTINRWKRENILPPADVTINERDYWYLETIEQNERERLSAKRQREAAA
jgi:hypothetical protein